MNTRLASCWVMTIVAAMLLAGCEAGDSGAPSTAPANSSGNRVLIAPATQPGDIGKIAKTDAEWKQVLTPNQYFILREKGTEPAFKNEYHDNHQAGTYYCAACGLDLFSSKAKFESGTGWPSFYEPIAEGHVHVGKDADGERDELTCPRCGGHLGHVFDDGPKPTGKRYCMDSGAMNFVPAK